MSEYEELPEEVQLDDIGEYVEPRMSNHKLHVDGELGKVIGNLDAEEAAEFTRLRTADARTDLGGVGVTAQRTFDRQGDGLRKSMEQAIANVKASRG